MTIQKVLLIMLGLYWFSMPAWAETHVDKPAKFQIDYDTEIWQPTHDLSPTVKFALVSIKRAASGRPSARLKIELSELDNNISLEKYVKNNLKVAASAWKIREKTQLPGLGSENVFYKLERKVGNLKKPVQKLFVKTPSHVYELTCSMSKLADAAFQQYCSDTLKSFKLLP